MATTKTKEKMQVNDKAVKKAQSLIKSHHYTMDSDWSTAKPSSDEENKFLQKHGWEAYGEWYLAIDNHANEETKDRYNFPYGDFKRVHRSGLIAAKQRAAQNHYTEIEQAADQLLALIDKKE